jgi:N-methyl-L-proline demethylase
VGAGPGGLEAARVAALRGHEVTVREAQDRPGGQVRLTAQSPWRREILGITEWRMAQCEKAGVRFRFNTWAEAEDVTALAPDAVILATGGLPFTDVLQAGNDLVVSAWDILSGDAAAGENVLVYDDAGDPPGLQAAQRIAEGGGRVEIVTPDRSFAPEVMGMNLTPYVRALQAHGAVFTVTWRLRSVRRDGNGLVAVLGTDYGPATQERRVDQVVVNHGTRPLDDLYLALKPLSRNLGAVDYAALVAGRPQAVDRNPAGRFRLWRIGDAVESRNIHAAILDAFRLARVL